MFQNNIHIKYATQNHDMTALIADTQYNTQLHISRQDSENE